MQSYVNSWKELLLDFTLENPAIQWECEAIKTSLLHYNLILPPNGENKHIARKVSMTLGEKEGL